MLALADGEGYVGASVGGLAHVCRVGRADCERALEILMSPDPDSRTGRHEGRRVEKADRGWRILNYRAYRERRAEDETGEEASCYVYYAVANGVVKIGSSKNPWARATVLRKSHPGLKVVAVERGGYALEFSRHEQFKGDRLEGEWFRLSPEIQAHIESIPKRAATTGSQESATSELPGSDPKLQEAEAEAEAKSSSSSSSPSLETIPERFHPDLQELLARIERGGGSSVAWRAEIAATFDGMHGPARSPAEVGQSIRDFNAAGADLSLRLFRGYLRGNGSNGADRGSGGRSGGKKTGLVAASDLLKRLQAQAPQGRMSLNPKWRDRFSATELRVLDAIGIDRIIADDPKTRGILQAQTAEMLREVAE